jgi:predicted transporter
MTLPLVAVIVLVIGLLLHWAATGSSKNGATTASEMGRSMIWIGMFFLVAAIIDHGALVLSR